MNLKALNQNLHLDIGILLFNDIELLDFASPYEVFCIANVVVSMQARDVTPFLVFTIVDKPHTIRTRAGLCAVYRLW